MVAYSDHVFEVAQHSLATFDGIFGLVLGLVDDVAGVVASLLAQALGRGDVVLHLAGSVLNEIVHSSLNFLHGVAGQVVVLLPEDSVDPCLCVSQVLLRSLDRLGGSVLRSLLSSSNSGSSSANSSSSNH